MSTPTTRRRVWVSGDYGDEPTCVSESIEKAMIEAERMHRVNFAENGPTLEWRCVWIDGWLLRCTATLPGHHTEEPVRLYVEAMALEDLDPNEP